MKPRFIPGTSVEVSLRDKQCHGAWFPATILKDIDHELYLVGYQSLRFEGCSKEVINAVHIRPSPPENSDRKVFAVSEKVDVYYDCGWWSAQVKEILPGHKYIVWFDHRKKAREFNQFELRCHMEWINGKWVQDPWATKESEFITGMAVEVSIHDRHYHSAWFPATILKKYDHNSFLIGYHSLRLSNEVECSKEILDAQHMRPLPPESFEGKEFVELEKVEAYYDCGWWKGKVTKVLGSNRYIVQLEHQNKGREFNHFELRCHMEWINGKWIQDSRGIDKTPNQCDVDKIDPPQLSQICNISVSIDVANEPYKSKRKMEQFPSEPCQKLQKGEAAETSTFVPDLQRKMPARTMSESGTSFDLATPTTTEEKALSRNKKGISRNLTDIFSSPSEGLSDPPTLCLGQEKITNAIECENFGNPQTFRDSSLSPLSVIEGAQCDLSRTQVQPLQNTLPIQPHSTNSLDSHVIKQLNGGVGNQTSEGVSPDNALASQSNMTFTSREPSAKGPEVQISMSFEEDRNGGDNAVEDEEKETKKPGFLFFNNNDEVTMENQTLPFNKRISVWEELEAMEIFRSIPQHPHFRPLEQLSEFLREGQAIGYMLSYAILADKASKAQVDEPRIALERKLNALVDLELLGFYVQPIRARLEELLRVKDCRVKLAAELKQVEDKIMKETNEKESLESELQKSDKKIKDLQKFIIQLNKKRQMTFMEKQRKDLSIAELQQKVCQVEEEIHRTKVQFDHAAAAPW
ncbi:hypothetical protein FRX31_012164 [Thalictrum thalictroides]|uniref:Agenet domain-containing protein n=1 Tax=Thalictrum thalictroides TaxID=46969 RepID=A0A7J6WNS5_THATH|nr:hypothetical protein FRX31_012164 [Thalictrum thalictroides]